MRQPPHGRPGSTDPERILHRLPEGERERFLAEYRTALAAARAVWPWRRLHELLTRWELVATAVSKPGYAQALEEARLGTGQYVTLEAVITRHQRHS